MFVCVFLQVFAAKINYLSPIEFLQTYL